MGSWSSMFPGQRGCIYIILTRQKDHNEFSIFVFCYLCPLLGAGQSPALGAVSGTWAVSRHSGAVSGTLGQSLALWGSPGTLGQPPALLGQPPGDTYESESSREINIVTVKYEKYYKSSQC